MCTVQCMLGVIVQLALSIEEHRYKLKCDYDNCCYKYISVQFRIALTGSPGVTDCE